MYVYFDLFSYRFGNKFYEKVANPSDVLLFKKRAKLKDDMSDDKFDANGFGDLIDNEGQITMEDLIQEYFGTQEKDNKLSVLDQREFGNAVKIFIDKDDKDALKYSVDRTLESQFSTLMEREDGLEVAMSWRQGHCGADDMDIEDERPEVSVRKTGGGSRAKAPAAASVHAISDDDLSLDEDEEPPPAKPARGRGRGRGSRGGRGRAAPVVTSSPVKRGGRGALATSSRDSLSLGSTQSTLAQSFARAVPRYVNVVVHFFRLISKYPGTHRPKPGRKEIRNSNLSPTVMSNKTHAFPFSYIFPVTLSTNITISPRNKNCDNKIISREYIKYI